MSHEEQARWVHVGPPWVDLYPDQDHRLTGDEIDLHQRVIVFWKERPIAWTTALRRFEEEWTPQRCFEILSQLGGHAAFRRRAQAAQRVLAAAEHYVRHGWPIESKRK